jgi:hypothetical protein
MFKDTEVLSHREKMSNDLSDLIKTLRKDYTMDHLVSITTVKDPTKGETLITLKFKDY